MTRIDERPRKLIGTAEVLGVEQRGPHPRILVINGRIERGAGLTITRPSITGDRSVVEVWRGRARHLPGALVSDDGDQIVWAGDETLVEVDPDHFGVEIRAGDEVWVYEHVVEVIPGPDDVVEVDVYSDLPRDVAGRRCRRTYRLEVRRSDAARIAGAFHGGGFTSVDRETRHRFVRAPRDPRPRHERVSVPPPSESFDPDRVGLASTWREVARRHGDTRLLDAGIEIAGVALSVSALGSDEFVLGQRALGVARSRPDPEAAWAAIEEIDEELGLETDRPRWITKCLWLFPREARDLPARVASLVSAVCGLDLWDPGPSPLRTPAVVEVLERALAEPGVPE